MKIPFLSRFTGDNTRAATAKISFANAVSAGHRARFGTVLGGILGELPDLLAVSVVDLRAGELLASHYPPGKLNPARAAAYNAEVIRQQQQALHALGLVESEAIDDILITLGSQWHLLRLLPGQHHFVHLMVSIRDTNLALAREVLRNHTAAAG